MKKLDGFDEAVIGVNYDEEPRLVYDTRKIVAKLVKDGMDPEDAEDHLDFNILGSHYGSGTPMFVEGMTMEEAEHIAALYSEEG